MSMVRLRRLQSDYDRLNAFVTQHPRLQLIQAEGNPPERYQIEFRVRSLRQKEGQLEVVASHLVEITLPLDYPRMPPLCRMLTPVFHPNIAPHAICIGDHWSAGESLPSLVARIGEILSYQSYNTKSPLNGEAAKWTDQNIQSLPLDPVSMAPEHGFQAAPAARPPERRVVEPRPVAVPPPLPASASLPTHREVGCPSCSGRLRVPVAAAGKFRCPRCQNIFVIPAV